MDVFIIQHEDALPSNQKKEDHLSKIAVKQVNKLVDFLKRRREYPDVILYDKRRSAFETAEMISFGLGGIHMEQRDYLNSKFESDKLVEEIKKANKSVMIVSHVPFLEKLVSNLVDIESIKPFIEINNASPLILKKDDKGFLIDTYIKNDSIR